MRMEFSLVVDGDERKVVAGPAEFIRLERRYQITAAEVGTKGSVEHLAFLAWSAMKRERSAPEVNGKPADFEQFIDMLDDLDFEDDDDASGDKDDSGN